MKKILFLITTLSGGGAEKVLCDIVNALPKDKYEITVQTIIDNGFYRDKLNSDIKYKTIIKPKNSIIDKIKIKYLYKVKSPRAIYEKYVKGDYDIEVAFLEGMPTRILAYSTNKKAKKYAWVHTDLMDMFDSVSDYKSYEENLYCYEKYDKIACVSDTVKQKFIERFAIRGEKVQTVYNVVLDNNIKEKGLQSIGEYKHDLPIVIGCGRLAEQKGFDRLLGISKKLLEENVRHYLWIVGEGALRGQFENYIKENGLTDTVTLWGFSDNPYKYMQKADLFVCSSVAEGYSLVVTEAVILNTPVISTDCAGLREPYDSPRCYKVVDNDFDSLYKAVKDMLTDKSEMEKAKAYTKKVSASFTLEKTLSKVEMFLGE